MQLALLKTVFCTLQYNVEFPVMYKRRALSTGRNKATLVKISAWSNTTAFHHRVCVLKFQLDYLQWKCCYSASSFQSSGSMTVLGYPEPGFIGKINTDHHLEYVLLQLCKNQFIYTRVIWRSLLLVTNPDWGCCRETAKAPSHGNY